MPEKIFEDALSYFMNLSKSNKRWHELSRQNKMLAPHQKSFYDIIAEKYQCREISHADSDLSLDINSDQNIRIQYSVK